MDGSAVTPRITCAVQSTNETTTVPAGTFTGYLVLRWHSEMTMGGGPTDHAYTEYWYAPEVGLVSDRDFAANWSQLMHSEELVSYRVGDGP